jgi:hypothetical protein
VQRFEKDFAVVSQIFAIRPATIDPGYSAIPKCLVGFFASSDAASISRAGHLCDCPNAPPGIAQ